MKKKKQTKKKQQAKRKQQKKTARKSKRPTKKQQVFAYRKKKWVSVPATKVAPTIPVEIHPVEKLRALVETEFKSTKFVFICETMRDGKAVNTFASDRHPYRSILDHIGMVAGAQSFLQQKMHDLMKTPLPESAK